jgi:hypothetical protein
MGFPKMVFRVKVNSKLHFFQLEGSWLSSFEKEKLARDGKIKNDGT